MTTPLCGAGAGTGETVPTTPTPKLHPSVYANIGSYLTALPGSGDYAPEELLALREVSDNTKSGVTRIDPKFPDSIKKLRKTIQEIRQQTHEEKWPNVSAEDAGRNIFCSAHTLYFYSHDNEETRLNRCRVFLKYNPVKPSHSLHDDMSWIQRPKYSALLVDAAPDVTGRYPLLKFASEFHHRHGHPRSEIKESGRTVFTFLQAVSKKKKLKFTEVLFWHFIHNNFTRRDSAETALTEEERIEAIDLLLQTHGAKSALPRLILKGLTQDTPEKIAWFKRAVPAWKESLIAEGLDETATHEELLAEREALKTHRPQKILISYCYQEAYGYRARQWRKLEDMMGLTMDKNSYYRPPLQKRFDTNFFQWFAENEWYYESSQEDNHFTLEQYNFFKERGMLDAWKEVNVHDVLKSYVDEDVKKAVLRNAETLYEEGMTSEDRDKLTEILSTAP